MPFGGMEATVSGLHEADSWWGRLTATRKIQIYKWIERPDTALPAIPGQLELLPETRKEGEGQ